MKQAPGDQDARKDASVKTMPRVTSRPVDVSVWRDGKESCVNIVSTLRLRFVHT